MTITFTLSAGSLSTAAGPFNISGTTSGGPLNDQLIENGVTKDQLLTGHTVTNVTPENITGGTIASTGTCTTSIPWYVTPPAQSATLAWSFSELGGARGRMDLYVNGSIVVTRMITSSGTYMVNVGDTINVVVNTDECGLNFSYAECTGDIINEQDCKGPSDVANIFTSVYTVQQSDLGTTLNLDCTSQCSQTGCS